MRRRNFIKSTATGIVAPSLLGKFGVHVQTAPILNNILPDDSDKVLVIIQLEGGNDGLNTLVPFDKWDELNNARGSIILPENNLLDLYGTDSWKLHPSMTGMRDLYNDGYLCGLQAVGYPNHSGSHPTSTDLWLNGGVNEQPQYFTGWAGRFLSQEYPSYPDVDNLPDHPPAIEIGDTQSLMFMEQAASMGILIPSPQVFNQWWYDMNNNGQLDGTYGSLTDPDLLPEGFNMQYCHALERLQYLRQNNGLVKEFIPLIYEAYNNAYSGVQEITGSSLEQKLSIITKLIAGGLKTKVYLVRHGSYDTHHNQLEIHNYLLSDLSNATKSFVDDLNNYGVGHRVLGMTISEFGRTIFDNGGGTDHGTSSCMFLFGNNVTGGVVGDSPYIPDEYNIETDNNIAMQYDMRDVYNTVLKNWFCMDQTIIDENILYGSYDELNIIANSDCVACPPELIVGGVVSEGTYQADDKVTSDGKVSDGKTVDYKAGEEIDLQPGFEVKHGSIFSADIEDCIPEN